MVFKGGILRALFLSMAGVIFAGGLNVATAATDSTYDQIFQDGLKAEANQKWADAVQFYVLALAKNPKSPWPKERLKSLFENLQKREISIDSYRLLLPPEMLDEFLKTGVIRENYDSDSAVSRLNFWIWAGILGLVAVIGATLFYFSIRSSRKEEAEFEIKTQTEKKKVVARQVAAQGGPHPEGRITKTQGIPKKEIKITEQASANITGVVANVKSLNLDFEKIKESTGPQNADFEALSNSGVIDAFVKDWVTEVSTDQTETGKFSKMTVDASLLFDEDKAQEGSTKKA